MNFNIEKIFEKCPEQWGLRGDPYLWDDLKTHLLETTTSFSEESFRSEIYSMFEKFTGRKIDSKEYIHVEKYRHGGMSSGMIDPEFWLNTAIPLLVERFNRFNQENDAFVI